MRCRAIFTAGTAAVAGAMIGASLSSTSATACASHTPIPDIEVTDQDGLTHQFYQDLIKGRVVMINFFFTSCGDTCPLVTENLRAVQDLLGERVGRDIFMYSVSLQPELETPAILKAYAANWDVRPGWRFLTGQPADLDHLRRILGFADVDPEFAVVKDSHTGLVRYGSDRLDRWAGTAGLGRPAWIAKAVTSLADDYA
jgi:protein SCO1